MSRFRLPDQQENWKVGIPQKINSSIKIGDLLYGEAKVKKADRFSANMVLIDTSTLVKVDVEENFKIRYGETYLTRVEKEFGSLQKVVPFILNIYNEEMKDQLNELAEDFQKQYTKKEEEAKKSLETLIIQKNANAENELTQLDAELVNRKNKRIAEMDDIEQKMKDEHEMNLKHLEQEAEKLSKREKKQKGRNSRIEKLESTLNEKEKELDQKSHWLLEHEKKLDIQFKNCRLVNPLLKETHEESIEKETIAWKDQEDIADVIRGALFDQFDLEYERKTVESFIAALMSNMIVVLNGPSGTGKSSLVNYFSKVIQGAVTKTIRVQSSWTDSQDLLGFFNPIDYQYIPTPFLDALMEARKNQDRLYLINLDEMNLAHVEYYFAEILSAREDDKPLVTLYSPHFETLAYQVIDQYLIDDEHDLFDLNQELLQGLSTEERMKVQNCFDLCKKYPAQFALPENVRFVGTLNMDQTVKGLSPKMIDRSFIITIEYPEDEMKLIDNLEQLRVDKQISMDIKEDFICREEDEDIKGKVKEMNKLLQSLQSRLNQRALKHIGMFAASVKSEDAIDHIMTGKILPRINVVKDSETERQFRRLLDSQNSYLSDRTKKKMQTMITEGKTITYWR